MMPPRERRYGATLRMRAMLPFMRKVPALAAMSAFAADALLLAAYACCRRRLFDDAV